MMYRVEDGQPWDSNSDVQGGGWATLWILSDAQCGGWVTLEILTDA